eukprot:236193-Chlamydomonas_euryale.AAC.1
MNLRSSAVRSGMLLTKTAISAWSRPPAGTEGWVASKHGGTRSRYRGEGAVVSACRDVKGGGSTLRAPVAVQWKGRG